MFIHVLLIVLLSLRHLNTSFSFLNSIGIGPTLLSFCLTPYAWVELTMIDSYASIDSKVHLQPTLSLEPGMVHGLLCPFFPGEKPYPCRFCGRRFRTNYNKLGHEKKCPDRHARAMIPLPPNSAPGSVNPADSPQATGPASSTTPVGSAVGSSDFH